MSKASSASTHSLRKLHAVYQNLRRVMVEHRGYDALPASRTVGAVTDATNFDHHKQELELDKFVNAMKFHQYVRMAFSTPGTGLPIYVYLFSDSRHVHFTDQFKRILQEYRKDPCMLIVVADQILSSHIQNNTLKLPEYRAIGIVSYLTSMFLLPIERAPMAPVSSRILSNQEAREVLGDLYCAPQQLPSMALRDPVCIKHGGRINQIMRLVMNSETTGRRIEYRRITAADSTIFTNLA